MKTFLSLIASLKDLNDGQRVKLNGEVVRIIHHPLADATHRAHILIYFLVHKKILLLLKGHKQGFLLLLPIFNVNIDVLLLMSKYVKSPES